MRIHATAEMIHAVCDALYPVCAAGDGAADDVRVTVQILRRAMKYEVEAQLDGTEIHGRRERIVDDGQEPMLAAQCRQLLAVGMHCLGVVPQLCHRGGEPQGVYQARRVSERFCERHRLIDLSFRGIKLGEQFFQDA